MGVICHHSIGKGMGWGLGESQVVSGEGMRKKV